jgi:uncharacterized membrane protein YozB (DUF420 family)
MAGLFGTRAVLQTDIDLILQFVVLALLLVGLIGRKRKVHWHVGVMAAAALLELGTFLDFMGPAFVNNLNFFMMELTMPLVIVFLIHAFTGTVTLVLGFGLILAWATQSNSIASCYRRKRLMRYTTIIWTISVALGVMGYLIGYVF